MMNNYNNKFMVNNNRSHDVIGTMISFSNDNFQVIFKAELINESITACVLVLLPAFDGRPGRTNINATQDIPVPNSMTPKEGKDFLRTRLAIDSNSPFLAISSKRISNTDALAAANMSLYIRGPSPQIPGVCI